MRILVVIFLFLLQSIVCIAQQSQEAILERWEKEVLHSEMNEDKVTGRVDFIKYELLGIIGQEFEAAEVRKMILADDNYTYLDMAGAGIMTFKEVRNVNTPLSRLFLEIVENGEKHSKYHLAKGTYVMRLYWKYKNKVVTSISVYHASKWEDIEDMYFDTLLSPIPYKKEFDGLIIMKREFPFLERKKP